jgi:fermentation-respiration switch protein FrsA (DUF1100 family)
MDERQLRLRRRKNLIGLFSAPFVLLALLWWFEYRNVFQPSRRFDARGDEIGTKPEDVSLTTSDGVKLHAWFYAAPTNSPRANCAVLIAHGNGGNISHRLHLYQSWLRLGVNVLAFDYRGYGRSEGRPSENGTYRDAQAAHAWLVQRGFAPERILAHGESLGGGVITELARREKLGGLVLQSTYSKITELGAELFPFLPARTLSRIRYDVAGKLPQLHVPVLVLHSREDTLIPFHHGERNFAAANEPKLFREIAGDHNDQPETDPEQYLAALEEFLRLVGGR